MKIVTFRGIKFILTSDTSEALGELHRQMPAIMADVTGMRDSQSGEQKYFNRRGSWEIKDLFGNTTVTFYSKIKLKKKKITNTFKNIIEISNSVLGLVYELGSRDDTTAIITEGFFVSLTTDWYTPSIIIELAVEDYESTGNVEMPSFISPILKIEELDLIPVHPADEGTETSGPGITCGATGCVIPTSSDSPDIHGYSGFYQEDNTSRKTVIVNGITLYDRINPAYWRIDWRYVCLGGGREDYYGWEGEINYNYNFGISIPFESSGAVYGTDIVDEIDWPENRAWYYITDLVYMGNLFGNLSGVDIPWSTGWLYDEIVGDCVTTRDPTGIPYWSYLEVNRKIRLKVPSEESTGTIIEFILWDREVGPEMTMPGVSCRIYEYQGLPVYILVLTDTILDSAGEVSVVKYFAVYRDVLYESEFFTTNESTVQPRLHDLYNAKKSAIAEARACIVTTYNTVMNEVSYEEDDNKSNLVQDRAMIFNMEE
jgi:hypothetical protein